MAHFARIGEEIVREIIVIDNENCGGGDFPDSEPIGQAFISSIGLDGQWLQTSYSGSFRSTFAGIGFTYDPDLNQFIAQSVLAIEEAPNE